MKINLKPKINFKLIGIFTIIYFCLYLLLNYNIYNNQTKSLENKDYTYIYQTLFKDCFNKIGTYELSNNLGPSSNTASTLMLEQNNKDFPIYYPYIQELGLQMPLIDMGIATKNSIEKMAIIKLKDFVEIDETKLSIIENYYKENYTYNNVVFNNDNNILFIIGTNNESYFNFVKNIYNERLTLSTDKYIDLIKDTNTFSNLLQNNFKNTLIPYFSMLLVLSFVKDTIIRLLKVTFNCMKNFKSGVIDFFKSPSRKFTFRNKK